MARKEKLVSLALVWGALACSEAADSAAIGEAGGMGSDSPSGAKDVKSTGGESGEGSTTGGNGGVAAGSGGDGSASGGSPGSTGGAAGGEPPGPGTSACDPNATLVDSLEELLPYLDDEGANVQLAPGTYRVTPSLVEELFPNPTLFEFTGSNSSYCFTGATIEFETEIFQSFGSEAVTELYLGGSNNQLKNLTMTDIGDTRPGRTALGIEVDGDQNLIEGFHLTIRGSQPYAYGDIFGKGSGYAIKHYKHAAILLTGTDLHLKDITIIHRAYGHGIFMQGAVGVLIEGIYMEGETRTTDEVLAEVGTSAAERDFETVWGGRLAPGYRFSLQEDGIRAYRNSSNGRIASDITIRDSTVKFMRSGVGIGLGEGEHHIENVTSLGNESGFWAGSNAQIINCRGDASVGPLYSEDVGRNRNSIELTLLDGVLPKIGDTPAIYLAGSNHDFTLRDGTTGMNPGLELLVGGTRLGHRYDNFRIEASNISFDNQTPFPVVLGDNSSGIEGSSCGQVTDNGSDNGVSETSCPEAK